MPLPPGLEAAILANRPEAFTQSIWDSLPPQDQNAALRRAASFGCLEVVNHLINLTPDEERRGAMIHEFNHLTFRVAALFGHFGILNRLIELTPDEEQRNTMIHADDNVAFCWALSRVSSGSLNIINFLIEQTPNAVAQRAMIARYDRITPPATKKKNADEFLDVVLPLATPNALRDLNTSPEKTLQLRQLRQGLIDEFGPASLAPNRVLAALLSDDKTLKEVKDTLLSTEMVTRSKLPNTSDAIASIISEMAAPIDFDSFGLNAEESKKAWKVISSSLFERPRPALTAAVAASEARAAAAAASAARTVTEDAAPRGAGVGLNPDQAVNAIFGDEAVPQNPPERPSTNPVLVSIRGFVNRLLSCFRPNQSRVAPEPGELENPAQAAVRRGNRNDPRVHPTR